jgi:hypothetical protein
VARDEDEADAAAAAAEAFFEPEARPGHEAEGEAPTDEAEPAKGN